MVLPTRRDLAFDHKATVGRAALRAHFLYPRTFPPSIPGPHLIYVLLRVSSLLVSRTSLSCPSDSAVRRSRGPLPVGNDVQIQC